MKVVHELNDISSGLDLMFFKCMNFKHFTPIIFSFLNRMQRTHASRNVLLNRKDDESSDDSDS